MKRGTLDDAAQLHSILASALDPIVTTDIYGTILAVSDSVERVFGWKPAELIGRNVSILAPEPHRSMHDGYMTQYRETGITNILGRTRELEGMRKDGRTFPMEISIARVDVPDRDEPLLTGIIHDISERKRAEEEIRLLERLALLVSEATDLQEAMRITLERICAVTGWEYGEAWIPDAHGSKLGDPVRHARDDDFARFEPMALSRSFERGEGLVGRVWVSHRPEWVDDLSAESSFARAAAARRAGLNAGLAVPILAGDDVAAVLAFFMTERREESEHLMHLVSAAGAPLGPAIQRKRIEAALAESERRLREMLRTIEIIAVTLDPQGRVVFCNDYLLRLTSWRAVDILGQDWFGRFVPGEQADRERSIYGEAIARGRMRPHLESEIVTKAGERRLIAWNDTILWDTRGEVIGTTGLGVDITDQRLNEQELAAHRAHLEALVEERTGELESSHEQLRLADRLASIGTLAAGLGHDMNNVLLPVRSRLDVLESLDIPREAGSHLAAVRASIIYLQQLSDGLHLLALDPDDAEASTDITSLPAWWESARMILAKAVAKDTTFDCDLSADLPLVAIASHRLTQAVLNLVVNAAEAVDENGTIRIRVEPLEDRRFARLTVTDDGRGMLPEVRRRALDPFFTTKRRGLGTGLGLSLVHGVAQAVGGSVEIESAPDRGTTVALLLPAAEGSAPLEEHVAPQIDLTAIVSLDDARIASLFASVLRAAGTRIEYRDRGIPDDGSIWITEPGRATIDEVKRFLAEPRRQVIICRPDSGAWADARATVVKQVDDFELVRRRVGEVVHCLTETDP